MDNKVDLKMNEFATRKDLLELEVALRKDIAGISVGMERGFKEVEKGFKDAERASKDQLKWVIILVMSALSLMMAFSKMT